MKTVRKISDDITVIVDKDGGIEILSAYLCESVAIEPGEWPLLVNAVEEMRKSQCLPLPPGSSAKAC